MAGRSSQSPRTVLEYLIRQRDRTYEELVHDIDVFASSLGERETGISSRHLRRLASGERAGMTPATRRVLQAFFNVPASDLLAPSSSLSLNLNLASAASAPAPVDGMEMLKMAAEKSRNFERSLSSVDVEVISAIEEEVGDLARLYPLRPLSEIIGKLVTVHETVLMLLERKQKPKHERRLYFLAAVISGLLAYAGNDVGKPYLAISHARSGFMYAKYADHVGLCAWMRGLQSFIHYWAGSPHEAIRYAEMGEEYARHSGGTASIWLVANQSRALAALGNASKAKALIEQADRIREVVREDDLDGMGGLCTFSISRQVYYAARAFGSLKEEAQNGERYAELAVQRYSDHQHADWDFSCEADARASLALSRALQGNLDGASEALFPLLGLPPEKRINDLVNTLKLLHVALNDYPGRASFQIQHDIEEFASLSLPCRSML